MGANPARLVGVSIAAFATSSPELSVGIQSAAAGQPEIALGDALGSNVVNVAVVLGVVLILGPLQASRRELTFAAMAPILTLLALIDGRLVRTEAGLLLVLFVVWLIAVSRQALCERTGVEDVIKGQSGRREVVIAAVGLITLIIAGRLIVIAAKGIGTDLGLDPFVVGATLVALGTSTPELATALIARRRNHADIGVGTVLGSNVFNNLWIVGIVALLHPVRASVSEVVLSVGACLLSRCSWWSPRQQERCHAGEEACWWSLRPATWSRPSPSRVTEAVAAIQQDIEGLAIEWIEIDAASPAAGATIGDGMYRTKTGSSIVAVIRDGTSIPAPGPDFGLVTGDVVVAVGTSEGLTSMRELIRH